MNKKNTFETYIPNQAKQNFVQHKRFKNWFQYTAMYPICGCIIIFSKDGNSIEIHQFGIFDEEDRGKGYGQTMIKNIRDTFPNAFIWARTWTHSRGFWKTMQDRGYIDDIANQYDWPCFDMACLTCHPNMPAKFARILIPITLHIQEVNA
jgi:hypothetical protein